ncbi:sensor histidine kinase [Microbacterium sp. SLBN-146]|uniref:sensor histidine kinase n=1 Tax=Microbacterium sp. SLBN-146 TaxID=2768457 RepID=UPI0011504CF0|nr:histidine kinase [Microbacterium sp. SLBN-146]TQJ32670.1 signal transduction histidine kinase [Microbacterium sp. SLBN-146]
MMRRSFARLRALRPFWAAQRPTRVERWALIVVVAVAVAASVSLGFVEGFDDPREFTLEMLLTLAFVLTLWNASLTALALLVLMGLSPLLHAQQVALLALAVGCLVVVRYSSAWAQAAYLGIFLAVAAAVHGLDPATGSVATLSAVLLVAAAASATGVVLRALVMRATRTREELLDARRINADLVQEERQRIADDLHDVVAHDLTVIAMHARLLERTDDPVERERSEQAILASARQALVDLRRVVSLASDDVADGPSTLSGGLAVVVEDFRAGLERAGYDVTVDLDQPATEELDRLTVSAIERTIREAGTNILKHAPSPERVSLSLQSIDGAVRLRIWNSLSRRAKTSLVPSGGYGTARMRERMGLLGGGCSVGPRDDGWLLDASVPVRDVPTPA